MDRLFSIDFVYINPTSNVGKFGMLGSQLLGLDDLPNNFPAQTDHHVGKRISNGDFPSQNGNNVHYEDVEIGLEDDGEQQ